MIVVSDTSPLNYLVLIQLDRVLPALFCRVLVPPAVLAELSHPASPPTILSWVHSLPSWIEVRSPARLDTRLQLGPGETEALSLALELQADVVLVDERKGFIAASNLGLFATGTIGVLEAAAERDLIKLNDAIDALRNTSFRATEQLLDEALARDARRRAEGRS